MKMKRPNIKPPKKIPGSSSLPGMAVKSAGKQTMWKVIPPQAYLLLAIPTMGLAAGLFYLGGYALRGGSLGGRLGLIIGAGVLLAAGAIYLLFRMLKKRAERKRAATFEENLKAEAAQASGPVSDPAEAARVDEMRQKFQRGIDVFRQYGKSVYDFPWYVIVGEPGAGKTEAIRHSTINFPEGLQEKQQGVGGTYSMDWWFTDRAILLDTAGALLTEADSAARFEEFLKMLKTYRPDCPINGMIIAVSVESLLLDDVEKSDQKALNLARQLTMIQKTLGLRFSIYLMITKSDLITGFKEFCDAPANAQYERQRFGWSNPHDLDAPINPADVCAELEQMATQLRYRRWTLLQDPIPKERDGRRINEVDALFTFPDAVSQVVKRLGRYLDIIFSDSEWSEMPPFFRGVYFTSSKREGAALDQQLAHALQMPPDKLPEGGIWAREKSMYLRELFLGKIFREKGLVTRTRDLGSLLRKRLVFYYAVTASLLVVFLGLGFMFYRGIIQQINIETPQFRYAHSRYDNGTFAPIVERDIEGRWQHNVREQNQLFQETAPLKPLPGFAFFRPLEIFYEHDLKVRRPQSHHIVVAGSVIKPLLDATRAKLIQTSPEIIVDASEMQALLTLMKVKAAVRGKAEAIADPVEDFIWPLLRYVLDPSVTSVSRANLDQAGEFMRGFSWTNELWMLRDDLSAFDKGFDRLVLKRESDGEKALELEATVKRFKEIEDELLAAESLPRDAEARIAELGQVKQTLDQLTGSQRFGDASHRETWQKMMDVAKLLPEDTEFKALLRELEGGNQVPGLGASAATSEGESDEGEPAVSVDPYLGITGKSSGLLYNYRYEQYQEMLDPVKTEVPDLIGKIEAELKKLEDKRKAPPAYDGEMGSPFTRLCENLAKIGHAKARASLAEHWRRDVSGLARASGRFPLVKEITDPMPAAQFPGIAEQWNAVAGDLPALDDFRHTETNLQAAIEMADQICGIVKLLWNAEKNQMATVDVTTVSAGELETEDAPVDRPPQPPGEEGAPLPPNRPVEPRNKGLDSCDIIDDNDKKILTGRIADSPEGKQPMRLDGGFRVVYRGWRDFSGLKDSIRYDNFVGDWGILKALHSLPSSLGAEPAIIIPTKEFPDANLRVHFRFASGRYDPAQWVSKQELDAAFQN